MDDIENYWKFSKQYMRLCRNSFLTGPVYQKYLYEIKSNLKEA